MDLTESCRMSGMNGFENASKVDMDESDWKAETCEVSNKWIRQDGDYYKDAVKHFEGMGLDMDECLGNLVVEGIDEVDKLEKAELVKEAMIAEGVRTDQDTRTTGAGGVSACTGVTTGTTAGTAAKAMAAMDAKGIVMEEKKKRAAAQQEASNLRTEIEQMKRAHTDAFMKNWNSKGLASVTTDKPCTSSDPERHAWVTMSKAMSDPSNKHLETISEELATYTQDSVLARKDGHYLNALVNVGMMNRSKTFLTEWDKEGPNAIGLLKAEQRATTLEAAKKAVNPLVAKAPNGGRLSHIVRDLQVMEPLELLAKSHGIYLQALFEAGHEDTTQ